MFGGYDKYQQLPKLIVRNAKSKIKVNLGIDAVNSQKTTLLNLMFYTIIK